MNLIFFMFKITLFFLACNVECVKQWDILLKKQTKEFIDVHKPALQCSPIGSTGTADLLTKILLICFCGLSNRP